MILSKIYQKIHFLLLLFLAILLVVACKASSDDVPIATGPSTSTTDCRMVKHEMGETEICGQPQRVAVLSPHILDIALSLGVQPVAYAEDAILNLKKFDRPTEQIPYLGRYITTQPINLGHRKNPSLELLAKVAPDLILSEAWLSKGQYDLLSQIAPTVLFSDVGPNDQQHWQHDIEGIAKALGEEAKAQELLARYPEQIVAMRDQLAPVVTAHPRVLCISTNNLASTIYLANAQEHTAANLLQRIGFEIVSPQNSSLVPGGDSNISIEVLPQIETDLIFVMAWSDDEQYDPQEKVKRQWIKNALLQQMPASQSEHVFFVDYYLWGSVTRGPITDQLILEQLPKILLPLIKTN